MTEAAAGVNGGAGDAAGGAAANTPWYQGIAGIDQDTIGFITSKAWDKKPAAEAAIEAVKSYREAQKLVGLPPEQLLRMPKDASDEAAWNNVWQRLGKPKEAKEYDFSAVKFTDGTALDDNFTNLMREQAFKLNLPKDTAAQITSAFVKYLEDADRTETAETTANLAREKAALDQNWGANKDANLFIAKKAASALGVKPETVAALESQIGYAAVMEMFRVIGSKIGEDKFITGQNNAGVMTRDAAVARINDLKADKAWTAAYLNGDAAKKREMADLHAIAYG